jgi:two-component system, OmpR family, alkaline phosphatase synthesis response regulator PhoP
MIDKPIPDEPVGIKIGQLNLDKNRRAVFINNKEIIFQRMEFEILYFLANNPGKAFSRDKLLKEIWGDRVFVEERTIDVHIRKIREKLENHSDLIETIKGVGYRFKRAK